MKRVICILSLLVALTAGFSSCTYREYAPAEYPAPLLYIPASLDGVVEISGESALCNLSEDGRKLLVHLGVAVSGLDRKEFPVTLSYARSKVNMMIEDGTFAPGTLPLPEAVCNIPEDLVITADVTAAAFDLAIQTNYLKDPEYLGRKFAVSVKIDSEQAEVNPDFGTVILLIDPSFIN